ncbi:hypothetical protein BDW72DRAFT_211667 [Aspergillus terricola var. indicus]
MSLTASTASVDTTAQSPPTYARRYGRTYRGLDNLTTASLCSRNVGKVRADCRLRVSKSQWGTLGVLEHPAAIVYIDIAIDQPTNCRLESASVLITLIEPVQTESRREKEEPLQMTEYYGPKQLNGEATKVTVTRRVHLVPQVNVMGSGGGGIGVEKERSASYHTRWTFTGGLLAGEHMSPHYRTLKWELRENESGRSNRNPVIHTAFALQHSYRPFIMRIEIQGRLQTPKDRLRHKIRHMRFPNPNYPEQGRSDTLVYPNSVAGRRRPLDMLAMGLSSAMERENLSRVPVEVPDALPVSFSVATDGATSTPQPDAPRSAQRTTDPDWQGQPQPRAIAPDSAPARLLSPDDAASIPGSRRRLSISNSSASATLVGTPRDGGSPLPREPCSAILEKAIDSLTAVPREVSEWEDTIQQLPPLDIPQPKEPAFIPEPDTLTILAKYPILIVLLRIMASFLDLIPRSKSLHENTITQGRDGGGEKASPASVPFSGQSPQ